MLTVNENTIVTNDNTSCEIQAYFFKKYGEVLEDKL